MPETREPRVICNTSPLYYLHQIMAVDVLRSLYGSIVTTNDVVAELEAGRAEGESVPDVASLPWVLVRQVAVPSFLELVTDLGRGEMSVLALAAQDPSGTLVVLDEKLGRRIARLNGLTCTGTAGILLKAKRQGVIPDVKSRLNGLMSAGFWLRDQTYRDILEIAGES